MRIRNYQNQGSYDIATGVSSKIARKTLPLELHQVARKRLAFMKSVKNFSELSLLSFGLHRLSKDRIGQWSIKINDQYRICFIYSNEEFSDVEIVDYH